MHAHHHEQPSNLNKLAFGATLHCLSGCAVGEVLGMVIATAIGLSNGATIALSIALAFVFGYAFTFFPLLKEMPAGNALKVALATDTLSIGTMEVVDSLVMLAIPGAMNAQLNQPLFWIALAGSLALAGVAAFPVNRWLVSKGVKHYH